MFVHGCFWHRHDCRHFSWRKTRAAFWCAKIEANQARDRRVRSFLRQAGWRVETIWECQLKDERALSALVLRLRTLTGG